MIRKESYNTKQKELIMTIIKEENHPFTIKDIYNKINKKTGLTTIYRMIDKLLSEGVVNKYVSKENTNYYQYLGSCDKDNHFYLKCDECGNLIHTDCDCIEELSNHLFKKHNFKPNKEQIIINGICENCILKKKEAK